ncbi:F-BOX/RNI/FBD-LIKE DOMAIN PROTEIN [Salix koriyanagi]|uniref:F-BOX/RNI/FBD-LIKE DOMAIN PROTEIN n=1 Tax=Salix koriyanagi TaxID=2511006 RepID=A0A9Q1AAH9_9ROSI|nr:F-BOX/RNI/FBD-LIKE DOMAIN PROTEIN [Salix koriyanagi]
MEESKQRIQFVYRRKRFGRDCAADMDTGIGVDASDRISRLPDHVLHYILSYLPIGAVVRFSVLSKTWHRISTSFPVSDFSEDGLRLSKRREIQDWKNKFINFVQDSLLAQHHHNTRSRKFRLSMDLDSYDPQITSRADHLLELAAKCGVSEFDLNFQNISHYFLPQALLSAEEITVLRLNGDYKLSLPHHAINWPSLRVLSLMNVCVDEAILQDLISGCPLIEKLALVYCYGVKSIRISGCIKLKEVEVNEGDSVLERIEIHVPSLQTFCYTTGLVKSCFHIDMTGCRNLEVLKLKFYSITEEIGKIFQDLIAQFPALTVLALNCYATSVIRIKISNPQLEKLQLWSSALSKVTITSPSLHSFKHFIHGFPSAFSLDHSSLQKATISVHKGALYSYDFLQLREYLGNYNQIKRLTLRINFVGIRFIPEILNNISIPALPDIKHLKIKIFPCTSASGSLASLRDYRDIVDGLLWVCHPETVLLVSGWNYENEFIQILCEKLMQGGENQHCCSSSHIKCWRHDLKDIQIEHLQQNAEAKALTCGTLLESLPNLGRGEKIRFIFNW